MKVTLHILYYYYKCAKRKKTHDCQKKPVQKEDIENEVVDNTIEFLFSKKRDYQLFLHLLPLGYGQSYNLLWLQISTKYKNRLQPIE